MAKPTLRQTVYKGATVILAAPGDSLAPAVLPIETIVTNPTGSLAAVEGGSDTFASTGKVAVSGALSASESGHDTFAASGAAAQAKKPGSGGVGARNWALFDDKPAITGKAAARETGADGFRATGRVKPGAIRGSMVASESGSDSCRARGRMFVHLPSGLIVSQARHIRRYRAALIRSS